MNDDLNQELQNEQIVDKKKTLPLTMEEYNQSETIENNSDNRLTAFTIINYIISFKQVISLVRPYHALIVEIIDYPDCG